MIYSTTFSSLVDSHLADAAARFPTLVWAFEDQCSSDGFGLFRGVDPGSGAPGGTTGENNLRMVIKIPVDDAEEPTAFSYTFASYFWEEDYQPVQTSTQTTRRQVNWPAPAQAVADAMTTFSAVLDYAEVVIDQFAHI